LLYIEAGGGARTAILYAVDLIEHDDEDLRLASRRRIRTIQRRDFRNACQLSAVEPASRWS
jgi:hypothetical protein